MHMFTQGTKEKELRSSLELGESEPLRTLGLVLLESCGQEPVVCSLLLPAAPPHSGQRKPEFLSLTLQAPLFSVEYNLTFLVLSLNVTSERTTGSDFAISVAVTPSSPEVAAGVQQ